MTIRALSVIAAIALSGCSNLGEFERELQGNDAKAWALCKKVFGGQVYSVPPLIDYGDGNITFAWERDKAERDGGPLFCRTNGSGTKIIEVRMSANLSS